MGKVLKGTKSVENLLKAFAGESQARNRYTMFAKRAETDGFEQISSIFLETADNERIHANQFYKHILKYQSPGEVMNINIMAEYPVSLSDTLQNLKAAAAGEHEEFAILYPSFADVADIEGFPDIANTFRRIAAVESVHEQRYLDLADNIANDMVFSKMKPVIWKCMKCGYHHASTEAPNICPACAHPKAYFAVFAKDY